MSESVVIIGSGPAGNTAAIYAGRAGLKPVVLAGLLNPGGALMNTTDIENFPGFPDGIPGPELMEKQQAQAERFGAKYEFDEAKECDFSGEEKVIKTEMGEEYRTKTVILAPGSLYRQIGCKGELDFAGRGVSYCATCDGFFFKDKKVVVIGGGDTAMEEALYLANLASSVTIVHRRAEFRASKIMLERAQQHQNITFSAPGNITEVKGDDKVTSVILEKTDGELQEIVTDGVFVAIGSSPQTKFLEGHIDMDDAGYIRIEKGTSKTNISGVFAAGDATDPSYRQAVVAAGAGAKAAIDAERYLQEGV